jgi:cytochrome c oxidase assembly protein subunit 15
VLLYLVVIAGGVVRMTGSGMGCPDWPKCFDHYIPPFSEADLPADYRQRLDTGHGNVEFNVAKAWIEYVNRLVSVIAGFAMLAFVWSGFRLRRWAGGTPLFVLTLTALALLLFEAWLGKRVVETNLRVGTITIHMLVAVVLVCVVLLAVMRTRTDSAKLVGTSSQKLLITTLLIAAVVQVGLGTQVREAIDTISNHLANPNRGEWVSQAGIVFIIHRTLSWGLLLGSASFVWMTRSSVGELRTWARVSFALVLAAALLGIVLQNFDMPAFAQPLHLLAGTLLVGAFFATACTLWPTSSLHPRSTLKLATV